jgi:hypothetical protein
MGSKTGSYARERLAELDAMAQEAGLRNWASFLEEQERINPLGHGRFCPPSCSTNHNAAAAGGGR